MGEERRFGGRDGVRCWVWDGVVGDFVGVLGGECECE